MAKTIILNIFVEGVSDERFFKKIFHEKLRKKYLDIYYFKYSGKGWDWLSKFFNNIMKNPTLDYFFVSDFDRPEEGTICINNKIKQLSASIPNLDNKKTQIVVEEIESWYVAGLDKNKSKKLGIKWVANTERFTKEDFEKQIPAGTSIVEFQNDILDNFSVSTGQEKNKSFAYYIAKHW